MKTGVDRAQRDRYREQQRRKRAAAAKLARIMRAHGWRWSGSMGLFVPVVAA